MVRGSRPVIDGTLQGPDALIELVAFHLHRMGAARANSVTFAADGRRGSGSGWIGWSPGSGWNQPGDRGARLVSCGASLERGVGGVVFGR